MAVTLPSPESLGLVLPQADRAPVSYTGGIAQTAQESIGRAVSGVGDAVTKVANDYADAQDKVNYAASYSNFLQQKLQLDQKYETDTDYATAPQRYSDDLQKAAADASAGIRSAPMQAQFMDTTARMREYAMNSQVSRAHAKSVDADRAYLTDQLQTTVDAAGQATDPTTRVGLYDAYGGLVQGMVAKGSITKSEGIKLAEAARNQGAMRYFKTLTDTDPAAAVRVLMPGGAALAPGLPTDLGAAIHSAAVTHGADEAVLARTAQIEDGNGQLGNGGGAFQFTPSTASAYELHNPGDSAASADAAARLQVDNKRALAVSLGRDPNGPELYLAHQQGASGAAALINDPDQRAVDVLTPAYGGDRTQATRAITGNGGSASMTAGAFTAMWADKFNGTAGHVPGPTAAPTQDAAGAPLYPKTGDLRDYLRPDQRADLMHTAQARQQAAETHSIAMEDHRISTAEKMLHLNQTQNEADLFASALKGDRFDPGTLAEAVRTQQITPAGYNALTVVQQKRAEGQDDPMTVAKVWEGIGDKSVTNEDIYNGMTTGQIKGTTGVEMIKALSARAKTQDSAVERGAYETLKTSLGGHALESGAMDIFGEGKAAHAELWTAAQAEWNQRVIVGRQNPDAVLGDMMPRYQKAVPSSPAAWPNPRMGMVQSTQDVAAVAARTKAAFQAGQISQDTYNAEGDLLGRYLQYYQVDDARRAAAAKATPSGRRSGLPLAPTE